MIWQAFASEWVKLRRRTLLVTTYAALAGVAGLLTVLVFNRAGRARRGGGEFISLARLAQPDGLAQGLVRAAGLLGLVALSIAGAQMALEYSHGTLRNLLVRQPRRARLLAGKYLGLLTFTVGLVLVAAVASGLAAFAMAHARGVSTTAWTSATGLRQGLQALGDTVLAIVGYATLGMALGVVIRSPVASVVVGLVYLLPLENILAAIVSEAARWLPGQLLDAIARGGDSNASFAAALWTTLAYLAAAAIIAGTLFARRDVTA